MHDTTRMGDDKRPMLLRPLYDAASGYAGHVQCETRLLNGSESWGLVVRLDLPSGEARVSRVGYATLQECVDATVVAIQKVLDAGG